MKILPKHQSKNVRFLYFMRGIFLYLMGGPKDKTPLERRWASMSEEERAYVDRRVSYYCRVEQPFSVGEGGISIGDFSRTIFSGQSNYFFDTYEYVRYFPKKCQFNKRFGDEWFVPDEPTFVKARPIEGDVANSVLLKLNKIRHFNFLYDRIPFEKKKDQLVWRGAAKHRNRMLLLENYFHHPQFDVGRTNDPQGDGLWKKPFMSIRDQLKCKFILSIEGNDVATNLKWIMSSGSICFMPKPTRETWFMEGTLVSGEHYVEVSDDFSDVEEKVKYYSENTDHAKRIIRNANRYIEQFKDAEREALIAYRVVEKYFALSGQL